MKFPVPFCKETVLYFSAPAHSWIGIGHGNPKLIILMLTEENTEL